MLEIVTIFATKSYPYALRTRAKLSLAALLKDLQDKRTSVNPTLDSLAAQASAVRRSTSSSHNVWTRIVGRRLSSTR